MVIIIMMTPNPTKYFIHPYAHLQKIENKLRSSNGTSNSLTVPKKINKKQLQIVPMKPYAT